jgi:hypothetical protein
MLTVADASIAGKRLRSLLSPRIGRRPSLAMLDTEPVSAPEARTAYIKMRQSVDALITGSEPIRARLQMAEESFVTLEQAELATELEQLLYHRIASSLVSGGPEDEADDDEDASPEAVAESIALLDDNIALLIARDMLRLYELTASPPDESLRWTGERWPDDPREARAGRRQ